MTWLRTTGASANMSAVRRLDASRVGNRGAEYVEAGSLQVLDEVGVLGARARARRRALTLL